MTGTGKPKSGMIDHMSVGTKDLVRARSFYDAVLGALGYRRLYDHEDVASGYGDDRPAFWVIAPWEEAAGPVAGSGAHICFAAETRGAVEAFHAAGLRAGATDNGAPGLRPEYSDTYYGAFLIDPEGNHLGAVSHAPQ